MHKLNKEEQEGLESLLLTKSEGRVIEHLARAWNAFLKLKPLHPDDNAEFRHAIHAAQNIVFARTALRRPTPKDDHEKAA